MGDPSHRLYRALRATRRIALATTASVVVLAGAGCYCPEEGINGRKCEGALDNLAILLERATTPRRGTSPTSAATASRRTATERASKRPRIETDPRTLTFLAPADATLPNSAEIAVPYELIPPFRVTFTVGLCDPAFYPAPSAVFGCSVIERGGAAREFSVECSRVDGITAGADFGVPASHAFPDAKRVDLAMEHDGSTLIASARDHEVGGAWFELSRMTVQSGGVFLPKLAAMNFEAGQMVSYYALRVPTNAPFADGEATAQRRAVRELAAALNDLADGADEFIADTPDQAAADAKFRAAQTRVQSAVAALGAAASPGKRRNAADRRLRKARRLALKAAGRLAKSLKLVESGAPASAAAVGKRVSSAALSLLLAADQILPDDLRADIGGATFARLRGK